MDYEFTRSLLDGNGPTPLPARPVPRPGSQHGELLNRIGGIHMFRALLRHLRLVRAEHEGQREVVDIRERIEPWIEDGAPVEGLSPEPDPVS